MFVRNKKNASGTTSVQVIDKSSGRYKVVKTIGSSKQPQMITELVVRAHQWIKKKQGLLEFDFDQRQTLTEQFINHIEQITLSGTELLLGKIFDEIGFKAIEDDLFKKLVIARLCFPASKLRTTDYLGKYHHVELDVQAVYRYLDKLYNRHKPLVQRISYEHTLGVLQGEIRVVFYDVTTLYFEIDSEDELRKTGFSKEGKHRHPQVVLGLLVSVDGYPLAYELFEGNKFEGHTMLPVIEEFRATYGLEKLVIVADSALLSKVNIQQLLDVGYEFILGARIKNQPRSIQNKIHALKLKDGQSKIIQTADGLKLIINYSKSRASKDRHNRKRGLDRLEKQIKSNKLTKANINNRGYNKFLKLHGEISVYIDEQKVAEDAKWDGLKGYITNTSLSKKQVLDNYKHLWQIEKAFRISKTELKIRPIYHRIQPRIEAHICLAFAAYKVYKELERQLKVKKVNLSPEKAIEIAKTIYSVKVRLPDSHKSITQTLYLQEEQKYLADLFDF